MHMIQDLNLAEGYLERAPPDIVRSAMPNGLSSRHLYSGKGEAQMWRPLGDATTQVVGSHRPEKHRNEAGGTWPRQIQGLLYAKYPDGIPPDGSALFPPPPVLPSSRSPASRLHSQSVDFPTWAESPPPWGDRRLDPVRDSPVAATLPTFIIQDFFPVPRSDFLQNTCHSFLGEHQTRSFVPERGPELPDSKDSVRSPLMNCPKCGPTGPGHFCAVSYGSSPSWNNMGDGGRSGWNRDRAHHRSRGVSSEAGTGVYYSRQIQQPMRGSENVTDDQLHQAKTQAQLSLDARFRNESNEVIKALLEFSHPGQNTLFTKEDFRNSENVICAVVNRTQIPWRSSYPVDQASLPGSGKFREFNLMPLDGYLSEPCLAVKLANNSAIQPKSLHSHGRHLLHGHIFSHGDNNSQDRTVLQDRTLSHDDTYSHDQKFSRDLNSSYDHIFLHDRSVSNTDGPTTPRDGSYSDSMGTVSGGGTLLRGVDKQLEENRRLRTPLGVATASESVADQHKGTRLVMGMFSNKHDSRKLASDGQEDLVSYGGFKETPSEVTKTATDCGKAMMDQHRKWIQMEERLLSRIYDLQKERSYLSAWVEELAAENWDLVGKFKDAMEQLENKELEMENVRRQLREKIVDMTTTAYSSQIADSTTSTFHRDAISSSNLQRCHDDDTDARRERQVAQEALAACQIQFTRERERWISEKCKVLRYQRLLQAKYENAVAENRLLREQMKRGFCPNATPTGSTIPQQRLTLLKDGPQSRSLDSVC